MAAPRTDLRIAIVGAGIAGLATAISIAQKCPNCKITVLENNDTLQELGAGIQCTPNASRILRAWGLESAISKFATLPKMVSIRRYADNSLIGLIPSNDDGLAEKTWKAPHWLLHRVDYQRILSAEAQSRGVVLCLGVKVIDVDDIDHTVTYMDKAQQMQHKIEVDLLVGADGIHSIVRDCLFTTESIQPQQSVSYCYRALIPRDRMLNDSLTAELIDSTNQETWPGPGKHIIAYPISNGQMYNLVCSIALPTSSHNIPISSLARYNQPANPHDIQHVFKDFAKPVSALLSLIQGDACSMWYLADIPSLPSWTSASGHILLLGDAAHATTPHAAQGGAMCIEDAETLGCLLASYLENKGSNSSWSIPRVTKAFEVIRKARCERVQEVSRANAMTFNLADGPEQEARDHSFRTVMESVRARQRHLTPDEPPAAITQPKSNMNMPFPHPDFIMWLYGYDARVAIEEYVKDQSLC